MLTITGIANAYYIYGSLGEKYVVWRQVLDHKESCHFINIVSVIFANHFVIGGYTPLCLVIKAKEIPINI